jgi:hypothetical protein
MESSCSPRSATVVGDNNIEPSNVVAEINEHPKENAAQHPIVSTTTMECESSPIAPQQRTTRQMIPLQMTSSDPGEEVDHDDDDEEEEEEEDTTLLSYEESGLHQNQSLISVGSADSTEYYDYPTTDSLYRHHHHFDSHDTSGSGIGGWPILRGFQFLALSPNQSHDYEYGYLDRDDETQQLQSQQQQHPHSASTGGGKIVHVRGAGTVFVPSRKLLVCFLGIVLVLVVVVFLPKEEDEHSNNPFNKDISAPKFKGSPQYTCVDPNNYYVDDENGNKKRTIPDGHTFYRDNSTWMQYLMVNYTQYEFRNAEYWNWGKTFQEIKDGIRHWKVSRYLPNLKTGDSIFESGCGIGLNLLLTVEILQEESNHYIKDLHLYGTEFGIAAAELANVFLDHELSKSTYGGTGKRGLICPGDSTHLYFIPDNTFDLVFTGYLSPVPDPWSANLTNRNDSDDTATNEMILERRREICSTRDTDWKSQTLSEYAQSLQNAWYGAYVSEMIRIAKPGAPIMIEFVSDPYCDKIQYDEWGGGVPYSFWTNGIADFGWDVDHESIDFEPDTLFSDKHRYHVMMRKRKR